MNKIYQKLFSVRKNAGFTLIELLIVVLIIGILAAVAVPQYQVAVQKARTMSLLPLLCRISDAENLYRIANGSYTLDFDDLDIGMPAGGTVLKENNITYITYNNFQCYIRTSSLDTPHTYSVYCNDLSSTAPKIEKYFLQKVFICWAQDPSRAIKTRICQSITGKKSSPFTSDM